jgi:hypothetical protein
LILGLDYKDEDRIKAIPFEDVQKLIIELVEKAGKRQYTDGYCRGKSTVFRTIEEYLPAIKEQIELQEAQEKC